MVRIRFRVYDAPPADRDRKCISDVVRLFAHDETQIYPVKFTPNSEDFWHGSTLYVEITTSED